MKFDDLYNQVFVSEQNNDEVASPEDFDDVDPIPLPQPPATPEGTVAAAPAVNQSLNGSNTLTDYITQLEEFANKLNGTETTSLQSLVSQLDKAESPFEGIYGRTSAEIVDAAKTLRSVSEKLKNFIIHAAKK